MPVPPGDAVRVQLHHGETMAAKRKAAKKGGRKAAKKGGRKAAKKGGRKAAKKRR